MPFRMFRRPVIALILTAIAGTAAGCACGEACCNAGCADSGHLTLAETEPVVADPDTSATQTADAVQLASAMTGRETPYRGLTPSQCQCLAVNAPPLVN